MKSKIDEWAEEIGDAYFDEAISGCKRMADKFMAEAEKLASFDNKGRIYVEIDDLKALFTHSTTDETSLPTPAVKEDR